MRQCNDNEIHSHDKLQPLVGTQNMEVHEAMHTNTCQHNRSTEAASQVVSNSVDREVVIMETTARLQHTTYNIILAFLIHPTRV